MEELTKYLSCLEAGPVDEKTQIERSSPCSGMTLAVTMAA